MRKVVTQFLRLYTVEVRHLRSPNVPMPPPRLWVIAARDAPIAAVFRRGPSKLWQIFKWNLAEPSIESGGFFRGGMKPEICDLSPNGTLLGYFGAKDGFDTWGSFIAVSKLPWLTALVAWQTMGRYTPGCRFVANDHLMIIESDPPFHGHWPGRLSPLGGPYVYRNMATNLIAYLRPRGVEVADGSDLHSHRLQWAGIVESDRVCTAHVDGTLGLWESSHGHVNRVWTADLTPPIIEQPSPGWAKSW